VKQPYVKYAFKVRKYKQEGVLDCGFYLRKTEGLFNNLCTRRGILVSWSSIFKRTAEIRPERGGQRPATGVGLRRGGAMAGGPELDGARGPANSEHLSLNRKRREVEKLTAESSRVVARAERGLGTRAAVGDGCGLGGFHTSAS